MAKHEIWELQQMQSLPLSAKILMTKQRIRDWYEYWDGEVYVSFSGGKDSTVLLDLVRQEYPDVPAVFVDTGLEYPEIREFVKTFDNVEWLRPAKNFKQVIEEYGYPFISKEVSDRVDGARRYIRALTDRQTLPYATHGRYVRNQQESQQEQSKLQKDADRGFPSVDMSVKGWWRYKAIVGELTDKTGNKSQFNQERWAFLLDAPFNISSRCCNVMKKSPVHKYAKDSGRKPMTAQMAAESRLRTQQWIKMDAMVLI